MTTTQPAGQSRKRTSLRTDILEDRPVNLDGFVEEWPEKGLVAMESAFDPEPGVRVEDGVIVELDGKPRADFDFMDTFIAAHAIDIATTEASMAVPSDEIARMIVDPRTSRDEVLAVIRGLTPAKILDVVQLMNVVEIMHGHAEDAGPAHARQPGALDQRPGQPHPGRRRRGRGRGARVRRAGDHARRGPLRPARRDRPAGRRPGRARRRAHPVRARGGHRAGARHARHHRVRRDHLDLRHRVGVRRRRRHPVVEDVPRLRLRLARHQDALHLGHRAPRCRWATPRASRCCTWRSAASSWPAARGCRACRTARSRCIGVPGAVPGGIRAVAAENLVASLCDLECRLGQRPVVLPLVDAAGRRG